MRLTRIIGLVAGAAAIILALASPLAAKSWRITDFQDTITVNPDGSAVVTTRLSSEAMNSAVDVTANAQIILLFEVISPRPS